MSGILRLESLTKGNTLKQGDKTPLKYRLFDADGEKLNIAGKSAKVRLVYPDFLTIGYEKDGLTVAQDDTVTFTIDGVIPSRIYHVEIIVDGQFIFPSRSDESKFTVDKSSLGTESNIIEIVGVDAVVKKAVDLINEDPNLIIDEDKLVTDIIENTGIKNIDEYYQAYSDVIKELSENKDYHSLPEIAGARGGFDTLGERLNDTTAQLAQTNHKVLNSNANLKPNISKGVMVSFVDDDISSGVWTRLKPLFESKGVPVTLGAISDRFKEGTHLTVDQALTLQNDLGWEIASHGKTPRVLTALPEKEIENELKESYDVLTGYGFDVNHYILSNGAHDERVRRLVRKYYKSASATTFDHGINNVPIRQYNLYRRDLYAYSNFTLDQHKAHVDQAVSEGGWLILTMHIIDITDAELVEIGLLIDYIKSKNAPIVTLSEGFEQFGNVTFQGDYHSSVTENEYHIVANNGEEYSNLKPTQTITASTPLNDFPMGESKHTFGSNSGSGFPGATGSGLLVTYRDKNIILSRDLGYQIFFPVHPTDRKKIYYRRPMNDGEAWQNFEEIDIRSNAPSKPKVEVVNFYPASKKASTYPRGEIVTFYVNSAGQVGFPGSAGIVQTFTVPLYEAGFAQQTFMQYGNGNMFTRTELSSGEWGAWKQLSTV